jgi:hypothetical protein
MLQDVEFPQKIPLGGRRHLGSRGTIRERSSLEQQIWRQLSALEK